MIYRIFETDNFSKNLKDLRKSGLGSVEEKLRSLVYPLLREEPQIGPQIKRLRSWSPPTWRYRIGDWRFFYEIDEEKKIVFLTAAIHRKDAYR